MRQTQRDWRMAKFSHAIFSPLPPPTSSVSLSLSLYLKIPTTLQCTYSVARVSFSLSFFFSLEFISSKFAFRCLHPRHEDERRREETRGNETKQRKLRRASLRGRAHERDRVALASISWIRECAVAPGRSRKHGDVSQWAATHQRQRERETRGVGRTSRNRNRRRYLGDSPGSGARLVQVGATIRQRALISVPLALECFSGRPSATRANVRAWSLLEG